MPTPTTLSNFTDPPIASLRRRASTKPSPAPAFPAGAIAEPVKGHEQPCHQFRRDPGALVYDVDSRRAVCCLGEDADLGGGCREADRVRHEVEDDVAKPALIGTDGYRRPRAHDFDAGLGCERLDQVDHRGYLVTEKQILKVDRHRPRLDACQVEDVVDDRQDVRSCPLDTLVESLPTNNYGKVVKRELRNRLRAGSGQIPPATGADRQRLRADGW